MRCLIAAPTLVLILLATLTSASGADIFTTANFHYATMNAKNSAQGQLNKELQLKHKILLTKVAAEVKKFQANRHDAFAAQQQGPPTELLAPVSDEPQCTDTTFATTMFAVFQSCADAGFPLGETFATDALSKTAWTAFCASQCVAGLRAKILGTNLEVCVHPQVKMLSKTSEYMCDTTSSSDEHCGVQYDRFTRFSRCSGFDTVHTNSTGSNTGNGDPLCSAASDVCEEYTTGPSPVEGPFAGAAVGTLHMGGIKRCRPVYSHSVMQGICEGGCMAGYLAILKKTEPKGEINAALKLLDNAYCGKASDGTYCTTTISDSLKAFEDGTASKTTFDSICGSTNIMGCFKKMMGTTQAFLTNYAKRILVECAIGVKNDTASVNQYCLPMFKVVMAAVKEPRQMMSKLCIKNAAGDYCMVHKAGLYANKCYNVARSVYTQRNCTMSNASCTASLQAQVVAMGCCAGTVQESYTKSMELVADDFPMIKGYTVPQATDQTQLGTTAPLSLGINEEETVSAGTGYMADLAFCGVTGLNETLRKRCKLSTTRIKKVLGILIRWSKLKSNAALKAKIMVSLRFDMANNLGIAPEEIVNDAIVENTNIQVTTAAGRRFQVQSDHGSTGSGCNYEFEIQGSDEVSINSASATFDTLDSDNSFTMTETESTTKTECNNDCTSEDGAMTTTTKSSGADAHFAGGLVALVMIFATLF